MFRAVHVQCVYLCVFVCSIFIMCVFVYVCLFYIVCVCVGTTERNREQRRTERNRGERYAQMLRGDERRVVLGDTRRVELGVCAKVESMIRAVGVRCVWCVFVLVCVVHFVWCVCVCVLCRTFRFIFECSTVCLCIVVCLVSILYTILYTIPKKHKKCYSTDACPKRYTRNENPIFT